ncbi:MAG: MFS transporter, partial [Smithellaceae bacterium]|nr:MFS transporter [Smithellaceae bacterium]
MANKIFYGWWIVLAGFLLTFYLSSIVFFGFTAFFEPLVQEFGWSYTQVSFAASLRGMEMGIFAPILGYLVDRFGSKKMAAFGIVTAVAGFFALSVTGSLPMFYASFLLLGLGAGACTNIVIMTAVANWFRKNVSKAMGMVSAGFGASGLMIPLIVMLIDSQGWRGALIVLGTVLLLLGLPVALILRDRPEKYGYLPDGESAESFAASGKSTREKPRGSFRSILRIKSFWFISICECLRMMALSAVVIHIMPYLNLLSIPRQTAGYIAAGLPLFSILGRFGLGWFGDTRDKRFMIALSYGLMALGLMALNFVNTTFFLFVFLVPFSVGFGGIAVLRGAMILEYYGRETFGKTLGITLGAGSLGGVIGPTLAGLIYDLQGAYFLAWIIFSFLLVISLLLTLKIERPAL